MEFSDNGHVRSCDHSLPQSPAVNKENQPHPLLVNQLSNYDSTVKQPHPPTATMMEQPHPSTSTVHSRYHRIVREHLVINNYQCDDASHDAWMLTCEYFNTVQPHPLISTFHWSEFNLHDKY